MGVDKISAKLLKAGRIAVVLLLTTLANTRLATGIFPDRLKEAQVTPLLSFKMIILMRKITDLSAF
jgi:hypothetical protein